jgi:protein phosphatase
MPKSPDIRFDVASVLNRGCRDYQEDAIATDFPLGAEFGYAVLSDGMGGHAAGDVASKIVVTEVFSELKFQSSDILKFSENVGKVLKSAAISANECMAAHASSNPDTAGMGATLVAPVFVRDELYWISIGDSPLYLLRDGKLRQLNEDHSLGPHIDYMVRSGMMSEDVGRNHPDRNALTSVLIGEAIERIDCPERPFKLKSGDILIVASDGLQFLSDSQISDIVGGNSDLGSAMIAEMLLDELRDLGDPEQDNVCFSVIRVDFREEAVDKTNIFTAEFDRRGTRPRQVTTRPLAQARPAETEEVVARKAVKEPEQVKNDSPAKATNGHAGHTPTNVVKNDTPVPAANLHTSRAAAQEHRETTPIFLRRRWLATDGGT